MAGQRSSSVAAFSETTVSISQGMLLSCTLRSSLSCVTVERPNSLFWGHRCCEFGPLGQSAADRRQLADCIGSICNSAACTGFVNLLDRLISDTLSQGYTDLQSLLKCLDHMGIVLVRYSIRYSMQSSKGCVRLHDALKCIVL